MAGPLIVGLISEKPVRGAAGQGRGRSRGRAGHGGAGLVRVG